MRHTGMLTRRTMLRSAALAGTTVAAPALLAACGRANPHSSPSTNHSANVDPAGIGLARAKVSRAIGGSGSVPAAVSAVQAFTVDLYRQLATTPGNVVCSPYSVAIALAMTRNGAKGRTASEMDQVLHAPELPRYNEGLNALTRLIESRAGSHQRQDGTTATIALDVANSLWGQRGMAWQQPFLEALARYYGTGMRMVDYMADPEAARLAINGWTSGQTHGKIPELLPVGLLDEFTRLVLVNALYLKAPWDWPFTPSFTKPRPFTLADGSRVSPPTMSDSIYGVVVSEGPGYRAVQLPYSGQQLAMTVVLPTGPVADLERSLDTASLKAMLAPRQTGGELLVTLPRWTFRLPSPLGDILKGLGMPTAFDPDAADLSPMDGQRDLFIGAVQHEAFISVDEKGTEAAAATAVSAIAGSKQIGPKPFVVDRPFMFVIHDVDTATPLFIGRVADPTKH